MSSQAAAVRCAVSGGWHMSQPCKVKNSSEMPACHASKYSNAMFSISTAVLLGARSYSARYNDSSRIPKGVRCTDWVLILHQIKPFEDNKIDLFFDSPAPRRSHFHCGSIAHPSSQDSSCYRRILVTLFLHPGDQPSASGPFLQSSLLSTSILEP